MSDAQRPRSSADRAAAHRRVVEALLEGRPDPATDRFDAELAAAVDAGRLEPETAQTLRWWQRTSVRAAQEYATVVLPDVLAAREQGALEAQLDVEHSARAWRQATAPRPARDPSPGLVPEADPTDRTCQAVRAALRDVQRPARQTAPGTTERKDRGYADPAPAP